MSRFVATLLLAAGVGSALSAGSGSQALALSADQNEVKLKSPETTPPQVDAVAGAVAPATETDGAQLAGFTVSYFSRASMPAAGIDTIHDTTGEFEIEFPSGGSSVFTIQEGPPNITVVDRQDPQGGGGGGGRTMDMEIVQMDLVANDGFFDITVNLGTFQPSLGLTTGSDAANDFPADSFFDIFVTIDIPGVGQLHNEEAYRIEASGIVTIPPWDSSYETPILWPGVDLKNPDGSSSGFVLSFGTHTLATAPPPDCVPTTDLLACEQVVCPVPTDQCVPTRVRRNPGGLWEVLECQCLPPDNACWLAFDVGTDSVWCEGICPLPLECTLISSGNPDGSVDFWCECRDPLQPAICEPLAGSNTCSGPCPPGMACVPIGIDQQGMILCDCRAWEECRAYDDGTGGVTCSGPCPSPDQCTLVGTDTDGDNIDDLFECQCVSAAVEACCFQDGSCQDLADIDCLGQGGVPQGAGSACDGTIVACCMADGTCLMADRLCCANMGGTEYPADNCTALEACCFDDGSCLDLDPLCCQDQGGTPQGLGNYCVDMQVPCCLPDGTCMMTDPLCCDEQGGVVNPAATMCLGDGDGDLIDDACDDCNLGAVVPGCEGFCPPTYECKTTRVQRWPGGSWVVDGCDCKNPDDGCWIEFDEAADQVWCAGVCPPGLVCTLMSRGAAQGYIEFWCECHDPDNPPPCGPQGDPAFVCEGACPPDTACVPAAYQTSPLGGLMVSACECRGYEDCRGYSNLLTPPVCNDGYCPPGDICNLIEMDTDGDNVFDTWRCECESSCVPTPDASACEPVLCPNLGEHCEISMVRSSVPPLNFPVAGVDTFTGTSGEIEIEFPTGGGGIYAITEGPPNITIVNRQDPVCDGINACTITQEIVQMDLVASDGFLDITVSLGTIQPSMGLTVGSSATADYPADSFFDVFVTIDIPDLGLSGLYNADPIPLAAYGITDFWGGPWFEAWPNRGVGGVELMNPDGTPSGFWIRRVIHQLPPPPPPVWEVVDCDCLPPNDCHVNYDPLMGSAWCEGGCPPGYYCELQSLFDPTGWMNYWCECHCACGDINHSGGLIDLNDFNTFAICFGAMAPTAGCPAPEFYCSDLNSDNMIDLNDFNTFSIIFNTVPTASPPKCLGP